MGTMKAKKPKKTKKNKPRKVTISDKTQGSTIDVKLYALNQAVAEPFMRDGQFSFRVAFDKTNLTGPLVVYGKNKCPVISMAPDDVLQCENETAQRMIENFIAPNNTLRNGVARTGGKMFADVTGTENQYDIDLDAIFDAVP
jgi:hypothetical protein